MKLQKSVWGAVFASALVTSLSACNRSDPPSDQLEQAAESVVEAALDPASIAQTSGPYAPRDECGEVAGAGKFLASLRGAVTARDADALVALTADDVILDFGGGEGHAQLRDQLAADDGAFWQVLDEVLALGCASDGEAQLTLPWFFAQEIGEDPYSSYIVLGQKVTLHSAAAADAPELAQISWDVVEQLPDHRSYPGFAHVTWRNPDAISTENPFVEGFVAEEKLRSLIDYRIIVSSRNGRWSIVSMVAGD